MTAPRSAADPLWKYGARAARPRRIGPLNLPMSANLPEISARPGSVVFTIRPSALFFSAYSGKSGVRRDSSARPILSGATIEWLPEFGVSWQVVQVPWRDAGSGGVKGLSTFRPPTSEIVNVLVLNIAWPRATARRASSVPPPWRLVHASKTSNTFGVKGA